MFTENNKCDKLHFTVFLALNIILISICLFSSNSLDANDSNMSYMSEIDMFLYSLLISHKKQHLLRTYLHCFLCIKYSLDLLLSLFLSLDLLLSVFLSLVVKMQNFIITSFNQQLLHSNSELYFFCSTKS